MNLLSCDYCGEPFEKNTHNQKYCSAECCRLATNERIRQRYYERKDNRGGKSRTCKAPGCETSLSRYNDEEYCALHARGMAASGRDFLAGIGVL